jgi:hypothetical protein
MNMANPTAAGRPITEATLLEANDGALQALFQASPAGEIPVGPLDGTAIIAPGTALCNALATLVRGLLWRGKVFDPDTRALHNRISPLQLHLIRGAVRKGDSWLDGNEAIVIDYSTTSQLARGIHDEIRLIAPRLYLGATWLWGRRVGWFSLRVPDHR